MPYLITYVTILNTWPYPQIKIQLTTLVLSMNKLLETNMLSCVGNQINSIWTFSILMAYTTTTEANRILVLYACAQESHVSMRKTNAITPRNHILCSRQHRPRTRHSNVYMIWPSTKKDQPNRLAVNPTSI